MSMRIFSASSSLFLLAACDSGEPVSQAQAAGTGRIACAIGGASELTQDCVVERGKDAGGAFLTLRHPDGGFRRFHIVTDGRGVEPADGAEPAAVSIIANKVIEVAVGGDRYRLPATIGSVAAKAGR